MRDLDASRAFCRAALEPLGIEVEDRGAYLQADELSISEGEPLTSGLHIAFLARSREAVHRFHEGAVAAGGTGFGQPDSRPYKPGY